MPFTDQTLSCRDCQQAFTFTAGEQEFYESRGLTNAPSRCPECRAAHKQSNRGQRDFSGGGGGRVRDYARCIAPPARAVERRRRCLFNHAVTDLCIAASVTRRNAPAFQTADDRAGHRHDRDRDETRRFL